MAANRIARCKGIAAPERNIMPGKEPVKAQHNSEAQSSKDQSSREDQNTNSKKQRSNL
jgi:hypothetical protein